MIYFAVVSYGMSCSSSSISSTSVVGVNGQMGNVQYGYGGVTNMDKAFRVSSNNISH